MLGIIGALDPHTHKVNLAELQGEGKLEREGVRPQFPNKQPQELGECVCEYVWEGERIEGRHVLEHSMGAVRCQPSATLCAGRVPLAA